ncbi:hypothetical protein GCM10023093_08530 [Nemorincola caseinilytica]|uniref:DUF3575 domain-containing protein n=1 Tax=Nemorincola caseinilytica TaxID=2054315 RepID=A0ABP8N9P7_9BACT
MKKIYTTLLFLLLACASYGQFSNWIRTYNYPIYRTAVTFSNPLSMNKAGGGVEHRLGNVSYMFSSYLYYSAYPGLMYDLELRKYARKHYRHRTRTKWTYQNFGYVRPLIVGIAGFDSDKLDIVGYTKNIYWYEKGYIGASAGWGRRYTRGMFFWTIKAGARYISFAAAEDPIESEAAQYYKLFYATGPGSVFELNFHFGIQY